MSAAVFSGHCSECASSVRSQDTVMIWSIFRIKDKLNCETYWYSVALKMQGLSCLESCARYTFGASILRLWGPLLQTSPAQWRTDKELCYIAGIFFPTALALIGYFEVKWQLTMKLFPAKISERATLQNLWRQRVTVHCYPRMLTDDRRYSEVYRASQKFVPPLYKSVFQYDWFC